MKLRTRLRFRLQWRTIIVLCVIWLMLWGEVTLFGIISGCVVGWLITVTFPLAPIHFQGRIRPWGLTKLVLLQLWDLASASFGLALAALSRQLHIEPAVIRLRLRSDSDVYQVQTAELLAIVPGTIVVESDRKRRVLYLHVFDVRGPEDVKRIRNESYDVERRVLEAFGSNKELRAYRARVAADTATDPDSTGEGSPV